MLAILLLNRMNARRRAAARIRRPEKESEGSLCRTCLSTEQLMPIFGSKDTEEKRSSELRLVTGLEIKSNDGLSQKICKACIDVMQAALLFRKTSKKAEKTLLSISCGIKVKKKYLKKNVKKNSRLEIETEVANDYSYDYLDNDFPADDVSDTLKIKPRDIVKTRKYKQPKVALSKQRMTTATATSYQCNFCSKEFRMKATYKAHLRFHTHYCICEACGKRCRNHNQLQEHKRARHGLGRIHKCAYCEYSSATKEALTIHERRHTGERPYVCDHCGATFHRRSNLVQHIAIHLPEKNFQCDMCPKRLKSRKFLQIHKHNAHTGRRYGYLCPVCEHRFEKPNKVRAHTRRVHGLPDDAHAAIVRVQL
ncbi:zinc finger protein Paris-like [Battus philenor]|uniref:zinc finger protein Paris-like n=1 Tax=Battus philenor TaxID=42288 RepID=UPI0035D0D01D